MKLCIRPHDVGKGTSRQLGEKIADLGFDGVQLAIAKAIENLTGDPGTLTDDVVKEVRKGFNNAGVAIPILGAYFNPVHSDKEKVRLGQAKFSDHLRVERAFGADYVASETGSYNDNKWTYNPKNQTEAAFQEVRKVFGALAQDAAKYGADLSIEGAWGHCIYCPKQMRRLIDEIDNGHVFTTFDLFNYLYIGNFEERRAIFDEGLELLGSKIVIFHIKDFVVENDKLVQVGVGKGIMGWDTLLPIIKAKYPQANLVFEGVPDVEDSLAFLKRAVGRH